MEKYESHKVPISEGSAPFVYMRLALDDKSYRLSGNYKYLNDHYNLKLNFIRDLEKIYPENQTNTLFKIENNMILIKDLLNWKKFEFGESDNTLNVYRLLLGEDSIMILHRNYLGDEDYSLFFSSTKLYNINQKLKELKDKGV